MSPGNPRTPGEGEVPSSSEIEQARREALRLKMTRRKLGMAGRIGQSFLESKLTPLIVVASLLLGLFAIIVTPSEEEPQIKVPMIDVMVGFPGATAEEVEHRVITPLEKLLYEIENVEYIYSISNPSGGLIIVRFLVGTDPDQAAVRVHTKIQSAIDSMPPGIMPPVVKPRTIDDVPVVAYTLWSPEASSSELRQVADEIKVELTRHPRVAQVSVIGGQRRVLRVDFDREALASRNISILQAYGALQSLNWRLPAGSTAIANSEVVVDVGQFLTNADEVGDVVLSAYGGRPVYLKDVAQITDGPEEPASYVWLGTGPAAPEKGLDTAGIDLPAVTIAVAKKPGTNAVDMVADLDQMLDRLAGRVIPSNVEILKTRDYGATADEKADELLKHLYSATIAVILLMWITLSWREATVVAVVIPVTLALTLAASYFFGYTLNRVSLFALVFSIGILVDDAIVVVENIHRHIKLKWAGAKRTTVYAVDEVGNPTILATFAIISALLPLAFVRGLMGPYMRPIPINASAAMLFSLMVAFTISPWMAYRLFRKESKGSSDEPTGEVPEDSDLPKEGGISRLYSWIMDPMIKRSLLRYIFLAGVATLLIVAMGTVAIGFTTVKMLPHDNKSELQVVIDAPEGFTLEQTNAAARELAYQFRSMPEVIDFQIYVGTSAPFNFNGLVRHYFLRSGSNLADIQVNVVHKHKRVRQVPRPRQRGAADAAAHRRGPRRRHQGGGNPTRPAGALHPGGRGLRADTRRPPRGGTAGERCLRHHRRCRRCGLGSGSRRTSGRGPRGPREGHEGGDHRRAGGTHPPGRSRRRRGRSHPRPDPPRPGAHRAAPRSGPASPRGRSPAAHGARRRRPDGAPFRDHHRCRPPTRTQPLPQEPPARDLRLRRGRRSFRGPGLRHSRDESPDSTRS